MKPSEIIKLEQYYPDYDPYTQLNALEMFVATLRKESAAQFAAIELNKNTGAYSNVHPMYGDPYVDDCENSEYFDAFMSSSIAACLAQYIEGVIRYEVSFLCYRCKGICSNTANDRYENLEFDQFWDVSIYFNKSKSKIEKNFVLGVCQLLTAIEYSKVPEGFKNNLQVLYKYRNNVMHNGVEWPMDIREKFKQLECQSKPDGFIWSTSDGKPSIAHIKNEYINELLGFCRELRNCFDLTG
jgi:hypothetical protein